MKNQIKQTEIEGEKIYLRKDFFGWRTVNPIKNDDGTINWKNLWLGNRKVIIYTVIWLLIMGFIFYGVNEMVSSCRDMAKNPCKYFKIDCSNIKFNSYNTPILKGGEQDGK